jgi:hypothetical protein
MAIARTVSYLLEVDWDFNGTFTDESAYLISAEGSMSYAPLYKSLLEGRGVVDSCTLTLRNDTGRFSSRNSAGALYAYLSAGGGYRIPVRLSVILNSVTTRIFTGVTKAPMERTATTKAPRIVTIACRSNDEKLLQARESTTQSAMVAYHDNVYSEAQIIEAWLQQAGYSSGDYAIDPGMYTIPWSWLDDESPLEDIWQLAAAAGGRFYARPDGVFAYENMSHYLASAHTSVTDSLTRDHYSDIELEWLDSDLYSRIVCETAPRQEAPATVVWEPDSPISIPAAGSTTVTARFRQPVASITELAWSAKSAASEDLTSSVSLATPVYYAQRVDLTWTNAHATRAAYLYGVSASGVPLVGGPTQEVAVDYGGSIPTYWTRRGARAKSLRGNPYIQSRAQAQSLASFLFDQCKTPRLRVTLKGVPGKPTYRLGDRLSVNDSLLMSAATEIMVDRIGWRLSSAGFSQEISGVDVTSGLYPAAAYFQLDVDQLIADPDPVFY